MLCSQARGWGTLGFLLYQCHICQEQIPVDWVLWGPTLCSWELEGGMGGAQTEALTSILLHLLGNAPREGSQWVSAWIPAPLFLGAPPTASWLAACSRGVCDGAERAGGGQGSPAQGAPVLPLANSPVGWCWGVPRSPSPFKPAFQAALPVAAGWWLPALSVFFLSGLRRV